MRPDATLLLVSSALAARASAQSQQLPDREVEWLREFFESTGGPTWLNREGWEQAAAAGWDPKVVTPCPDGDASPGWIGIKCQGQGDNPKPWHVEVIELDRGLPGVETCSGNNITGYLPASFDGVPSLTTFKVAGPVPQCAGSPGVQCDGNLPDRCLDGIGQLSGTLPSLPANAAVFGVYDTQLSGTLPTALPSSATLGLGLQNLLLGNNRLSGTVPWETVPTKLKQLELRDNVELSGTLAKDAFVSADAMIDLSMFNTQLSGTVPRLPASLQKLQLHKNGLTVFPSYLDVLVNLQWLTLDARFRGAGERDRIPEVIQYMKSLTMLKMSAGQWSGEIPTWLGDLTDLTVLELFDNLLTGTIPDSLCNLKQLTKLLASNNVLTGGIPKCLGELKSLEQLWLNHNELSGEIPQELSRLSQIFEMPMNNNRLTGILPSELGQLQRLTKLMVNDNLLSIDGSTMDDWLPSLSELTEISLSRNAEIRTLPRTSMARLSKLTQVEISGSFKPNSMALDIHLPTSLQTLDLAGNNFSGTATIPDSWDSLSELNYLDLSNCSLSDNFDARGFLAKQAKLEVLLLSANKLTRVPQNLFRLNLRTLDLGYNQIAQSMTDTMLGIAPGVNRDSGKDPTRTLERLDVSNNLITGSIPSNLFSTAWGVDRLSVLDASHNKIEGTFPHVFAMLRLFSIDVSNNRLSGHLHESLAILHSLHLMDIRENDMQECATDTSADCTGQLQMHKGSTVIDKGDALCYEVGTDALPHAQLLLDPTYSPSSACVCKDEYILGTRSRCKPCNPRFTETLQESGSAGGDITGMTTILDCRSGEHGDASRLRDGYFPLWCGSGSVWQPTWSSASLNCSGEIVDHGLAPQAIVRCPVVARDHNPCLNEGSSNGYSALSVWQKEATPATIDDKPYVSQQRGGCAKGYAGPACMLCDRPGYARELGSRICTKCDGWSEIVPWLYLIAVVGLVVFLARKDATPSNLGSSFIFYFQAMTLIKRSVLPWPSAGNPIWMKISSGLNFNPSMSACVSYLQFLEDPEARFLFTMALPLFIVGMVCAVWTQGVAYDCYLTRNDPPLELGSVQSIAAARITQGGNNYRPGEQPLIAQDRALKVLFALVNLCYLPLCYQTFSASHWASLEFEFVGNESVVAEGRYLINAPTINVPDNLWSDDPDDTWWLNAAARLELGFWAGLVLYVIGIPVAIYQFVYIRIRELDDERAKRMAEQFPRGQDAMTMEELRETSHRQNLLFEEEMDKQARIVRIGGAAFCAFKYEYRWWPFVVTARKLTFTWVIAYFPPDDPWLSVLVFVVLLVALLMQVEHSPMMGRLDNALEQFTLGVLLVCFTLAQVVMADGNQSRATLHEVPTPLKNRLLWQPVLQ